MSAAAVRCRIVVLVALLLVAASATAADVDLREFEVELPAGLRANAAEGEPTVAHARIAIGLPARRDATNPPTILLISATADEGYNASRRLMKRYAEVATSNGWIIVAADAAEAVAPENDDVSLRLVLDLAALAVLGQEWPETRNAPLAFGGFSGGSKIAGWLAAAFARQGRTVIGVYQAGINEDTLVSAASRFDTLDVRFRQIPVFLQSGRDDEVATPIDHREIAAKLKRAGFANLRIEYFAGRHEVAPGPLRSALRWFREVAHLPDIDE